MSFIFPLNFVKGSGVSLLGRLFMHILMEKKWHDIFVDFLFFFNGEKMDIIFSYTFYGIFDGEKIGMII